MTNGPQLSAVPRREPTTPLWRDMLPFAGGALTALATLLVLGYTGFRASAHQVWIAFVPVGAIAAGACAASGYYLGAFAGRRRPRRLAAALMRASAVPVYAAICLFQPEWPAVHAISLDPSGLNTASAAGAPAYVLVVLAGLGFAVGTAAVVHFLAAPIHCHKCRQYLHRRIPDAKAARTACDFDPSAPAGAFAGTAVPVVVRRSIGV